MSLLLHLCLSTTSCFVHIKANKNSLWVVNFSHIRMKTFSFPFDYWWKVFFFWEENRTKTRTFDLCWLVSSTRISFIRSLVMMKPLFLQDINHKIFVVSTSHRSAAFENLSNLKQNSIILRQLKSLFIVMKLVFVEAFFFSIFRMSKRFSSICFLIDEDVSKLSVRVS